MPRKHREVLLDALELFADSVREQPGGSAMGKGFSQMLIFLHEGLWPPNRPVPERACEKQNWHPSRDRQEAVYCGWSKTACLRARLGMRYHTHP